MTGIARLVGKIRRDKEEPNSNSNRAIFIDRYYLPLQCSEVEFIPVLLRVFLSKRLRHAIGLSVVAIFEDAFR